MGFKFQTIYNVRCGAGMLDTLGDEVKAYDPKRVLFVTDAGLKQIGASDRATEILKKAGISYEEYNDVQPNPNDRDIEAHWDKYKNEGIGLIIGFGGGSAMDTAKACAVLATNPAPLKQYHGRDKIKNRPLPIIAIPTTAGTGSEVSMNASIVDAANHFKLSLRSSLIMPSMAILDPTLLASLPQKPAAESAIDAVSHASEGFVARRANQFTDSFAIEALGLLFGNIRQFVGSPANTEAAEKMAIGAMMAGTVFTNAGTGAAHALARALGGLKNTGHGLACGLFTPYVCRYNFIARPHKYRKMLELMGVSTHKMSDPQVCDRLFDELIRLLKDLGLPTKLSEIGVQPDELEKIAQTGAGNDPEAPNPRLTPVPNMLKLLKEAY